MSVIVFFLSGFLLIGGFAIGGSAKNAMNEVAGAVLLGTGVIAFALSGVVYYLERIRALLKTMEKSAQATVASSPIANPALASGSKFDVATPAEPWRTR